MGRLSAFWFVHDGAIAQIEHPNICMNLYPPLNQVLCICNEE